MSKVDRPIKENCAILRAYRRDRYATYRLRLDVVWVTARKRLILRGALREALIGHLYEAATAQGCQVLRLVVRSNLCHLRLDCPPDIAPKILVHRLKQHSAKALNKTFGEAIRGAPSLWTSRYLISTEPFEEEALRAFRDAQPDR